MTPPNMEYTTRCKMPGCKKVFITDPFEPPIIGQPNDRFLRLADKLSAHLQDKHPEMVQRGIGAIIEYGRLLTFSMFQCEDPNILETLEPVRAAVQKFTRRYGISDAEIQDKVSRLEVDPEDEQGVAMLLSDMRDLLTEQGRYAPESQTEPAPLVTPA
jgi:hypothetical protein